MSWIASTDASTSFEAALGLRPALLTRYRAFYAGLWDSAGVPRRTLELCRLRIAAIHACDQEWQLRDAQVRLSDAEVRSLQDGDRQVFASNEQAALQIAELMPFQHHAIGDGDIARLQPALKPAGVVALLTAIAFFDVNCRLKLTLAIQVQPAVLKQFPFLEGALA